MACFPNLCETSGRGPLILSEPTHCSNQSTGISRSAAAPLIKCAECRVQFAKLQVFCTCKYTLIAAIKEDYGRLADGECNVLIRVSMHCNTNRMLTLQKRMGC